MDSDQGDPYVHEVDGTECRHKPQPDDRPGHYPSRRGLVIESPIVRDWWDLDLDLQEAESEERWWIEQEEKRKAGEPNVFDMLIENTGE